MTTVCDVDIAVVGGGVVGATLANLLLRQARIAPQRLVLLEPEVVLPLPAAAPLDLRVWALSRASQRILQAAGAWSLLDLSRIEPYEAMCVWHEGSAADSADALRFAAADSGESDLGAIVEVRAAQTALLSAYAAAGGSVRRESVQGLTQTADAVRLQLSTGTLTARLVVAADGAASPVRGYAGIAVQERSYGQQAIVAALRCQYPHQHTAWQVFLPTGPLALLPQSDGSCSLVWSAVNDEAQRLLALDAGAFGHALTRATGGVLGELSLLSERLHFPLRRLTAERFVAGRCALIGDAAHVIHPLAGQGVNQGLLDAAVLCEAWVNRPAHEDVGARAALRRYERERRLGNALMATMVDGLDRLLTGAPGIGGRLAREGMAQVARNAGLRRWFAAQAMGTQGPLPQAARAL